MKRAMSIELRFSLLLSLSLLVFMSSAPVALAGCFPDNLIPSIAESLPHPEASEEIGCPNPPGPVCDEVDAPWIESVVLPGPVVAKTEVVLRVPIPDPPDSVPESLRADWGWTRAEWIAETYDAASDSWNELWRVKSTDSVEDDKVEGGFARFGANGLTPNKTLRFRVGFCKVGANNRSGCTCESDPSINWNSWNFPQIPPVLPGLSESPPMVQQAEDNFRRRFTDRKAPKAGEEDEGDGLGPGWTDPAIPGFDSWIHESGDYALALQGATPQFGVPPEDSVGPRSYTELAFALEADRDLDGEVDNGDLPGYNMDVRGRMLDTGGGRGYWGKLVRYHHGVGAVPALEIGDIIGTTFTTLKTRHFNNVACPEEPPVVPENQAENCPCRPPLEDYIDYGDPPGDPPTVPTHVDPLAPRPRVFLSIEVDDDDDSEVLAPIITVVAAWENDTHKCPAGGEITDCPFYCIVSTTDESLNGKQIMYNTPGSWGIDAHEGIYRLLKFRAGGQPVAAGQ